MVLSADVEAAGELLLFEAPLALAKPDFAFAAGGEAELPFPLAGDSECVDQAWQLTYELLATGRRAEWARRAYVVEPKGKEVEAAPAVAWLAARFGCGAEDVLAVFRAVANNAFSLDTAVLRIKYGAAFFAAAAYLNHSCAPNCASRRMGGNMAVFAARDGGLRAGQELTHSYIGAELLAAPEPTRAAHLHFVCACERCARERGTQALALRCRRLLGCFPAGHAATAAGRAVGAFKLACVENSADAAHSSAACERLLAAGDACFAACGPFLRAHPAAAIEVSAPYLQALWAALASGDAAVSAVFGGAVVTMCTAVASRRRHGARAAASLFHAAAAMLSQQGGEGGESHGVTGAVCAALEAEGCVLLYLLGGALRRVALPLLLRGLASLRAAHGGSLAVLNEDLSCVGVCPPLAEPPLAQLVEADQGSYGRAAQQGAQQLDVSRVLGAALARDAARDECSFCRQREPPASAAAAVSGGGGAFSRCAKCRSVKYCCRDHQRQDWALHKRYCNPVAVTVHSRQQQPQAPVQPTARPTARPQPTTQAQDRDQHKKIELASSALAFELC